MHPSKYQWLLFDADGTLFDYDQAESYALENAFRDQYGSFDQSHQTAYQKINQAIWQDFERGAITAEALRVERFQRLFASLGIDLEAGPFSAVYLQHLGEAAHLVDGALSLVRRLAEEYRLALITNGLREVQRSRLARSPLQPYFPIVIISDEIGVAKPDPALFEAAFEQMGYPPKDQVLMIGDSLSSDILGANNYGIDVCWYNPKGKKLSLDVSVQYEIRKLTDLYEILGESAGTVTGGPP